MRLMRPAEPTAATIWELLYRSRSNFCSTSSENTAGSFGKLSHHDGFTDGAH